MLNFLMNALTVLPEDHKKFFKIVKKRDPNDTPEFTSTVERLRKAFKDLPEGKRKRRKFLDKLQRSLLESEDDMDRTAGSALAGELGHLDCQREE